MKISRLEINEMMPSRSSGKQETFSAAEVATVSSMLGIGCVGITGRRYESLGSL